jgi:hypothetical protein
MQFVPVTSIASLVRMPTVDYSSWVALDCCYGHVLIHFEDEDTSKRGLVVWDPVTGSQQHLSVPFVGYPSYSFHNYTGAVHSA